MSKKQKRRVSSGTSPVSKGSTPAVSAATTASAQARVRSQIFEFKPDYTYIKNDLKRISIIAGSFLVALVILSFVVPLIFH